MYKRFKCNMHTRVSIIYNCACQIYIIMDIFYKQYNSQLFILIIRNFKVIDTICVCILHKICLSISMNSYFSKQLFSFLRCFKIFTRKTIGCEKLTNIAILHKKSKTINRFNTDS